MFWLIVRAWGYMAFNMNTNPRQEWDTRRARCGAGLRGILTARLGGSI
jgi:hypothetical protein